MAPLPSRLLAAIVAVMAVLAVGAAPTWAQGQVEPVADASEPVEGFWDRANLLGDPGEVRSRLETRGLTFSLSETSEVLGNPTGGRRRAVVYAGLTRFTLAVDTAAAFGLPGGSFFMSSFHIHGRGLSANALGSNLHTVSSLEPPNRGTRLGELWYEQAVAGGWLTIRFGSLLADTEFITSDYGALFTNATFGWPTFAASALPVGGPAYPAAALGVRVKLQPAEAWTLLAGVFNGDPSGPEREDRRPVNQFGTAFRTGDGVFAIAEAQYALNGGEAATGLPGIYKFGGWYHSQRHDNPHRGTDGLLLAHPLSNGQAAPQRGNLSLYGVADQLVWRKPGTRDQGVGVFGRLMGSPGDRNLLSFYADAGVTYKGVVPGRENDTLGFGIAHARFSDRAAEADRHAVLAGSPRPIRRGETVLEVTYQADIAPWWQVQPVAQYVVQPSGEADQRRPERRLPDALVLGIRTTIVF